MRILDRIAAIEEAHGDEPGCLEDMQTARQCLKDQRRQLRACERAVGAEATTEWAFMAELSKERAFSLVESWED